MTATEILGTSGTRRGRERARVVVLGGGYGGQLAAQTLALRTDATVTLVNDGDRFVQRVRLHQLATGQPVDAPRFTDLLAGTGVRFVDDRATGLDLAAHRVLAARRRRARLRRAGLRPRQPRRRPRARPRRVDGGGRGPARRAAGRPADAGGWRSSGPG